MFPNGPKMGIKRLVRWSAWFLSLYLLLMPSGSPLAQGEDESDVFVFTVAQGGEEYRINPIERDVAAISFYDYFSDSGHTPFMEDQVSKIYLYRDTATGQLSLIAHHAIDDGALDFYGVKMDLQGVPEEAYVALADDSGRNEFNLENEPEGNWTHTNNSDGGVLSGLPTDESWSIRITPNFLSGITKWECLSQNTSSVRSIALDMGKQITISMSSTPEAPDSGGNGCFVGTATAGCP